MKKYNQSKSKLNLFLGVILGVLVLLGIFWLASPSNESAANPSAAPTDQAKVLAASEEEFDFGTISMAKGNVAHNFTVKNTGNEPVSITKVYTSCMCTSATLETQDGKVGPFGMPGHGALPRISKMLNPGEEAQINVFFDPAAHGPTGVGRIERAVYLENQTSKLMELRIKANVTP